MSRSANHTAAAHRYSVSSQQTSGTSRYEEVAAQKAELEEVKRENEGLKERIRELERLIREGATSGSEERGRSGGPKGGEGVKEMEK